MYKWVIVGLLCGVAFASTASNALAASVPEGFAQGFCKGQWVRNMSAHTSICAFCQVSPTTGKPTGRPRCDFFVCDDSGYCEWQTVEKRSPRGRWSNVRPSARSK
jgi:hypothetical protein